MPKHYYFGNRRAQILHIRLRTGCSSLNLDLFLINITDSTFYKCGSIEDAQHFVFHCSSIKDRDALLNSIRIHQTPTLDIILHGDDSLSIEINQRIFAHVHKYIIESRRFQQSSIRPIYCNTPHAMKNKTKKKKKKKKIKVTEF